MTHLVTENCIKCKHTDCVEVCPVDCFYEGANFLAINPDECIDCGVCVPECPINAIVQDTEMKEPDLSRWLGINAKYSNIWPNITNKKSALEDAEKWNGVPNKFEEHFSEAAGE